MNAMLLPNLATYACFSNLFKRVLLSLVERLALMIDLKPLAYTALRVLGFVFYILFKKLLVVVEHYLVIQKVF